MQYIIIMIVVVFRLQYAPSVLTDHLTATPTLLLLLRLLMQFSWDICTNATRANTDKVFSLDNLNLTTSETRWLVVGLMVVLEYVALVFGFNQSICVLYISRFPKDEVQILASMHL